MGNTQGLIIRDAIESDIDSIRKVTWDAYQEYSLTMSPPAWRDFQEMLRTTLASLDGNFERIVAEQNGEVIASVLLFPAKSDAYQGQVDGIVWPEVRLLAVAPNMRGNGISKALMNECITRARNTGSIFIGLHTSDVMQIAKQLYERLGFERVTELDFFPGNDVHVLGYRLHLLNAP